MGRVCLLLISLAACDRTPRRWVYLVNPTNEVKEVVFRTDPKEETHLHKIPPRSYISNGFAVGDYFISRFDAGGKPHAVPVKVDHPSAKGEVDDIWFDVAGGTRYLLVNCDGLYAGNAFSEPLNQALFGSSAGKVKEFDGEKPFEIRLRGQVELVPPFDAIPKEKHLGDSIWKLIAVDKQLPAEQAVEVALKELSLRK
jgi:hypothetical protein